MKTSFGPNAQFLNSYFGASAVDPSGGSSLIATACPHAERKNIASSYLAQKFQNISETIDSNKVTLNEYGQTEISKAKGLVPEGILDAYGYLGALFNHSAAPFKNLFKDFGNHVATNVDPVSKMVAKATNGLRTPLAQMIEAGVDSATHIWSAVLKSILTKEGSNISLDQFKKAYEKSKELLLDITDVPLNTLITLESYLFKREKPYYKYSAQEQANERLSSNVKHEAISYEKETGAVNLDQGFMSNDDDLASRKAASAKANDSSYYEVHGCAGKQMIPLFFKYMDQIFEEHLYPHFDEFIKHTSFKATGS